MPRIASLVQYARTNEPGHYLAIVRLVMAGVMYYEYWKISKDDYQWVYERFYVSEYDSFYQYARTLLPAVPHDEWLIVATKLLGLSSVMFAIGLFCRFSVLVYLLGFGYMYLASEVNYLNHQYLFMLVLLSMAIVPGVGENGISVDRWIDGGKLVEIDPRGVPRWVRWYLGLHLDLVYVYGCVAKVNVDWLRAEPLNQWLRYDGSKFHEWFQPMYECWWFYYLISYGGIAWDATAPILCRLGGYWRIPGVVGSLLFHGFNYAQMHIGAFPWMAMGLTTLYFPSDWPLRVKNWFWWTPSPTLPATLWTPTRGQWIALTVCILVVLVQVVVPIRSTLFWSHYRSDPAWSDEGHQFSWRMKLRDREVSGEYYIVDIGGEKGKLHAVSFEPIRDMWKLYTDPYTSMSQPHTLQTRPPKTISGRPLVSPREWQRIKARPIMIKQFAEYIAMSSHHLSNRQVEVRGDFVCSINHRPWEPLIRATHTILATTNATRSLELQPDALLAGEWVHEWIEPVPALPGLARFQYPWVFIYEYLFWGDNPCMPWYYQRKNPKIVTGHSTECYDWWYKEGNDKVYLERTSGIWTYLWEKLVHRGFDDRVPEIPLSE